MGQLQSSNHDRQGFYLLFSGSSGVFMYRFIVHVSLSQLNKVVIFAVLLGLCPFPLRQP